jgi:MYXO-CTERM domain-containing protein
VFAYVSLGGSLDDLGSTEAIVAIALLAALALLGALFVRRQIALGRA